MFEYNYLSIAETLINYGMYCHDIPEAGTVDSPHNPMNNTIMTITIKTTKR